MTDSVVIPVINFNEVATGLLTKLYKFAGSGRPAAPSVAPAHAFSLGLSPANIKLIQKALGQTGNGGVAGVDAVKQVSTLSYTGQPAADDTITLGGKTYTFKASGATGDEINISGVDAKSTYDALVARVLTDTATTLCTGVNTGTGATGSVVFTANTAGTPFTASESLANATLAATTANVVAVSATLPLEFSGTSFRTGTQFWMLVPLTVNGKADTVVINAITPASATITTATARVQNLIGNALAGTAPTSGHGFVYSLLGASRSQISTAMQASFSSTIGTSFPLSGSSSQIITLTALPGAAGNALYVICLLSASVPNLTITLDSNDVPVIAELGPAIPLGSTRDYNHNDTVATVVTPQDSARNDFGTSLTGAQAAITFTANQSFNAFLQRDAAGAAAFAADGQNYYLGAGGGDIESFCLVAVTDSGIVKGQKNIDVIFEAYSVGGLLQELTKATAKGLPFSLGAFADDSPYPTGFRRIFRQVGQV